MKRKRLIGIFVLLAVGVLRLCGEAGFYAIQQENGVQLQWHPRNWQPEQVGYALKRRELAPDAPDAWKPIGPPVIRPSVNYSRDYSDLGLSRSEAKEIKSRVKSDGLDKRSVVPEAKMAELLAKAGGIQIGDAVLLARDSIHSLAWGLGCRDRTAKFGVAYEYGLFVVKTGGVVVDIPEATVRPVTPEDRAAWVSKPGLDFYLDLSEEWVDVAWKMPLPDARRLAIASFRVDQKIDGESEWVTIGKEIPYGILNKVDSRWGFRDKRVREKKAISVVYRFTPVDYFQKELKPFEFSPPLVEEPNDPEKFGPKITQAVVRDGKLTFSWEQPAGKWRYRTLSGFRLSTKRFRPGLEKLPKIPADKRELEVDVTDLRPGDAYVLNALYDSWEGYSLPVASSNAIDLPALIKAEAERPKPAKE